MPNRVVQIHRWQIGLAFGLLTLGFVLAVGLVSRESHQRSAANRKLIEAQGKIVRRQIHQRAEVTLTTCIDQNGRHDKTLDRLDEIIEKAVKADPGRAAQIRHSRASTIFIIEALAPHQNCRQLVLDRFGFIPRPTDGGDNG